MKILRPVIRTRNDCEEWDDDEYLPWFYRGDAEPLSQADRPRFHSVSPAAHAALSKPEPSRPIGFHIPKP